MRSYYNLARAVHNSMDTAWALLSDDKNELDKSIRYTKALRRLLDIAKALDAEAEQHRAEDLARAKREILAAVEQIANGNRKEPQ